MSTIDTSVEVLFRAVKGASRMPLGFNVLPYFMIILFTVLFMHIRTRERRMQRLGSRAPGPISWVPLEVDVLVELLIRLKNDTFFEWTQKQLSWPGRTLELNILSRRIILTDDAENIKTIFAESFSTWIKGQHMKDVWRNVLGDSIFTADGEEWLVKKGQLRGHLARARADDLENTEVEFQQLKKHLIKEAPQNVYDLMDRYQLDVVTRVFFGLSANSLTAIKQTFREAMEVVLHLNTKRILLGWIGARLPMKLVVGKSLSEVNTYTDKFVDRTIAQSPAELEAIPEKERNLVQQLAIQERNPKNVKDQLLAVLTAGKDPSSMIIAWAIYELARNPDCFRKLENEVATNVGFDKPPTASQLNEMGYLKLITKETLRLHHSLGYNIRTAKHDTTLPHGGGPNGDQPVAILKDTQCVLSILSLQHRTDIWGPDAGIWRPERWDNYKPPVWDFLPFNHGPRVCLGRVFGQQQIEYALVRIIQEFGRWELWSMEPMKVRLEMNTKMASHACVLSILGKWYKVYGRGVDDGLHEQWQ